MRNAIVWFVAISVWLAGPPIARALASRMMTLVRRMRRALRRVHPRWNMSLLVWIDDDARCVHPSVQIDGDPIPRLAKVAYRLTDKSNRVRLGGSARFPAGALGREMPLPPFTAPDDLSLDELARGRWEITVTAHGRALRRWTVWPARAGGLNAEAELV